MKIPFIARLEKQFLKEELSSFQKQAVIRLIEKKDEDKKVYPELETIIFAMYRPENSFKSNGSMSEKDSYFCYFCKPICLCS